jgi:sulfur carrier protein ThiS
MGEIQVYASLLKWVRTPRTYFEVKGAKSVADIMDDLGIPEDDVAIVMINGKRGHLQSIILSSDSIKLFPLIGGG